MPLTDSTIAMIIEAQDRASPTLVAVAGRVDGLAASTQRASAAQTAFGNDLGGAIASVRRWEMGLNTAVLAVTGPIGMVASLAAMGASLLALSQQWTNNERGVKAFDASMEHAVQTLERLIALEKERADKRLGISPEQGAIGAAQADQARLNVLITNAMTQEEAIRQRIAALPVNEESSPLILFLERQLSGVQKQRTLLEAEADKIAASIRRLTAPGAPLFQGPQVIEPGASFPTDAEDFAPGGLSQQGTPQLHALFAIGQAADRAAAMLDLVVQTVGRTQLLRGLEGIADQFVEGRAVLQLYSSGMIDLDTLVRSLNGSMLTLKDTTDAAAEAQRRFANQQAASIGQAGRSIADQFNSGAISRETYENTVAVLNQSLANTLAQSAGT